MADSRARKLRWFGLDRAKSFAGECRWDQDIAEYGGKFHMNDIAATIGIEQLRHVRGNIECHRAHAAAYDRLLTSSPHVRPLQQEADRRSNHWLYTLRVRNRAHFINYMNDAGIEVSRVHIRNDHYSMFRDSQRGLLPGVTEFDTEQVNIPCGWWLTPEEVSHVVSTLLMYKGSD